MTIEVLSPAETQEALLRLSRQPVVSPVIFPEGTRSRDSRLGRFHSSAQQELWRLQEERA